MTSASNTGWRFNKRLVALGTGLALVATGAIGAQTFAGEGDDDLGPEPAPGEPFRPEEPAEPEFEGSGDNSLVITNSTEYDPTILTKSIPASAFVAMQGEPLGFDDAVGAIPDDRACLEPGPFSIGNSLTELRAPVELPDGSRINRIRWYGSDNAVADTVEIKLIRETHSFNLLTSVWASGGTVVDEFSTSGVTGVDAVAGAADLDERVGTPVSPGLPSVVRPHRFHSVYVAMDTGEDQRLCGVEVDFQIPISSADPGTVFHPVESFRAFDSRQATFGPLSGRLMPNESKVIDITDGYDSNGVAIPAQADLVPSNATSITYNITVAGQTGPNFVAVTSGDAASFTASAINYPGSGSLANAGTVTVAADQTIKVWGGDNTGSAHVIIDVTGYYAPAPPLPNMAN